MLNRYRMGIEHQSCQCIKRYVLCLKWLKSTNNYVHLTSSDAIQYFYIKIILVQYLHFMGLKVSLVFIL